MDTLPFWVCRNLHETEKVCPSLGDSTKWDYCSKLKTRLKEHTPPAFKRKDLIYGKCGSKSPSSFVETELKKKLSMHDKETETDPAKFRGESVVDAVDCKLPMKCTCGVHQLKLSPTQCIATLPSRCIFNEKRTEFYVFSRARHKCMPVKRVTNLLLSNFCLGLEQWFCTHALHSFFLFLLFSSMLRPVHSYQRMSASCFSARATYKNLMMPVSEQSCQTSPVQRFSAAYYNHLRTCTQFKMAEYGLEKAYSDIDNASESSGHVIEGPTCASPLVNSVWWKSTLFCNHFSWEKLLSCNYSYYGDCKSSCNENSPQNVYCDVIRVLNNDQATHSAYLQFVHTLLKYATPDDYSINWNESECFSSYRAWVCTQYHQVYETQDDGSRSKVAPCDTYCDLTEKSCPFFRIFNRTKLRGGQPTFICHGFDMENPAPAPTKCHYFELSNSDAVDHRSVATQSIALNVSVTTVHKIRHTNTIIPNCNDCHSMSPSQTNFAVAPTLRASAAVSCYFIWYLSLLRGV